MILGSRPHTQGYTTASPRGQCNALGGDGLGWIRRADPHLGGPRRHARVARAKSASPVVARTCGRLVASKRPSRGRMKPIGARHGSLGSRATTRSGTSSRSWYSTPFAVSTDAPCAPFSGKATVPSFARYGRSQPAVSATHATATTRATFESTPQYCPSRGRGQRHEPWFVATATALPHARDRQLGVFRCEGTSPRAKRTIASVGDRSQAPRRASRASFDRS